MEPKVYLRKLSKYYRNYWATKSDLIKGKTEEELESLILSQIDDKEKKFENFVMFTYLLLYATSKDWEWYESHKKFKSLYWLLIMYDEEGFINYWEYEDYGAIIV